MNLLDIFLLPKAVYGKLTENRTILYIGILLVGIRNVVLNLGDSFLQYFLGKPQEILIFNASVLILFIIIIGIIDVVGFSVPMFDFFNLLKKREGDGGDKEDKPAGRVSPVMVMKVYIIANLLVSPVDIPFYIWISGLGDAVLGPLQSTIVQILALAVFFWYYGIIVRGTNVFYRFKGVLRVLAVAAVLLYSSVLGTALGLIYQKGILALLK